MNLNKTTIAGRLTRDPELRATPNGTSVCELGVAVNRRYTSNGETKEDTTFIDVTAWGKTAEVIAKYFTKGKQIYLEGRLRMESWDDKTTGKKRSKLSVVADTFQFVDGPGVQTGATSVTPQPTPRPTNAAQEDEDDIPF